MPSRAARASANALLAPSAPASTVPRIFMTPGTRSTMTGGGTSSATVNWNSSLAEACASPPPPRPDPEGFTAWEFEMALTLKMLSPRGPGSTRNVAPLLLPSQTTPPP